MIYWQATFIDERKQERTFRFFAKFNICHPTTKFDYNYIQNNIDFIDTTVCKNKEQNKLLTTVY